MIMITAPGETLDRQRITGRMLRSPHQHIREIAEKRIAVTGWSAEDCVQLAVKTTPELAPEPPRAGRRAHPRAGR